MTRLGGLLVAACLLIVAWQSLHARNQDTQNKPAAAPQVATDAELGREVRSLLARNCYKCHGPDEKTRKAKLRLDLPVKPDDDRIAPGHPDKSELVARVFSTDADTVMPPASTKLQLTREQKEL